MKIVLGLVAFPVVAFSGAFGYRMYLEATAPEDLSLTVATEAESTGPPAAEPGPEAAVLEPDKPAEVAEEVHEEERALVATEHHEKAPIQAAKQAHDEEPEKTLSVPPELDAKSAQSWIFSSGLISLKDGALAEDRALFQTFTGAEAARVYDALLQGGSSFDALRMHFFALCGELSALQRREFASASGAVFNGPDQAQSKVHMGDFTRLLFLQTGDSDSTYARAVRDFAAVLTDVEMIHALTDLGVIETNVGSDGWSTHVQEKMSDFDADTLMSVREAIQDEKFGDRKLLREYLGALSEEKRSSELAAAAAKVD